LAAVVPGIVSTLVFRVVLLLAPPMEMLKIDMGSLPASMDKKEGKPLFGWLEHLMIGIVFADNLSLQWGFYGEKVRKQPALQSID
jgi:hypothetical protein